jgi:hypothetical protein
MVDDALAPSSAASRQAPSRKLAFLSTVLRTWTGLRKVGVRIFEHFILIPVTYLILQIGPAVGGGGAGFFFNRSLVEIAVWVLLFWHGL